MKLLLVADLHLEKGLGYSDDRLAEQEEVWAQALALAERHDCGGILFAGDATEYRQPSSAARAAFQRPILRCPVPIVAIPGNHDVKHPRLPTALDLMGDVDLLRVSREPELVDIAGCIVATLPWTPVGRLVASRNGGSREAIFEHAEQALVQIAEALAVRATREHPGVPTVLLGHWALDFATTPTGVSAMDFHEPVLVADRLAEMFDAVVFGHVHQPQRRDNVISVGSPMPLDFGEASCEHGVWVLDPEQASTFIPIESRPFRTIDIDFTTEGSVAIVGRHDDVEDAIVRIRVRATEEQMALLDLAELRRVTLASGAHRVWQITPQIERVERARVEGMGALAPDAAIDAWITARGVTLDGVRERAREVLEG